MAHIVNKHELRGSLGENVFSAIVYILLLFAVFICLYPLWFTVISSFSDADAVYSGGVRWLPRQITGEAYQLVFTNDDVWRGYANSIFYTFFGTLFNLFLTVPAAYALSKKSMLGHGLLTTVFLIPMYLSGGLIPGYLLLKNLGVLDTRLVLIIVSGLSIYNMIVTRTYFSSSIPDSLYEAARIDGASEIRIFAIIALPLSMPVVAVIGLYYASAHWNSYFDAMIYLTDNSLKPLQSVLQRILINSQSAYEQAAIAGDADDAYLQKLLHQAHLAVTMKYSLVFIASAPMLILYPFIQKYFVKGVMVGSVKG